MTHETHTTQVSMGSDRTHRKQPSFCSNIWSLSVVSGHSFFPVKLSCSVNTRVEAPGGGGAHRFPSPGSSADGASVAVHVRLPRLGLRAPCEMIGSYTYHTRHRIRDACGSCRYTAVDDAAAEKCFISPSVCLVSRSSQKHITIQEIVCACVVDVNKTHCLHSFPKESIIHAINSYTASPIVSTSLEHQSEIQMLWGEVSTKTEDERADIIKNGPSNSNIFPFYPAEVAPIIRLLIGEKTRSPLIACLQTCLSVFKSNHDLVSKSRRFTECGSYIRRCEENTRNHCPM